ncbi:MAG: zinc metallopeptidase [Fidelibacterota bacterium]
MPYFFFDSTMVVLIPAIILALYAQYKVKSVFSRYSGIRSSSGLTGYQIARELLAKNGIFDVEVEETRGVLSDHYDPRTATVRLSPEIYEGDSISSLGVAAHEVGHAIQHKLGYVPLKWRTSLFPVANIGSSMAIPFFIIGLFLSIPVLMDIGIIFFTGAVLFQVITLPVEFNASNRALMQLEGIGFLRNTEVQMARKVLHAASLTYVAATAVAVAHLIRLLLLRREE